MKSKSVAVKSGPSVVIAVAVAVTVVAVAIAAGDEAVGNDARTKEALPWRAFVPSKA